MRHAVRPLHGTSEVSIREAIERGPSNDAGEVWKFAELLQELPAAVYATDASGKIIFYNEAAAELWGVRPAPGEARWCGSWRLWHADGEPMAHDKSPMALALRGRGDARWMNAVAERPDGSRVPFAAYPSLLKRPDGTIYGAVNTLLDLTDNERADAMGIRLAAIVESSSDAIISKNLDGTLTSWNRAAETLFGYTAEEAVGRSVTMLIPADRQDEEVEIISRIRRGDSLKTYETIRQRKDGSFVPVSLTVSPVRDGSGRIVGASKIVRDISDRVESDRRMRLLLRELNHRVKNQYAVILSMIRETKKRSRNPDEFERLVRERIMALSASHDLLVSDDWKGTTIFELLIAQLRPFAPEDRVLISGPPIRMKPNVVQHLGIAFHELAANSAIYGTLSQPTGEVRVGWSVVREAGRARAAAAHLDRNRRAGFTGQPGEGLRDGRPATDRSPGTGRSRDPRVRQWQRVMGAGSSAGRGRFDPGSGRSFARLLNRPMSASASGPRPDYEGIRAQGKPLVDGAKHKSDLVFRFGDVRHFHDGRKPAGGVRFLAGEQDELSLYPGTDHDLGVSGQSGGRQLHLIARHPRGDVGREFRAAVGRG